MLSLLDKVEQGQSVRADDLIGGYSYTSQFWDQQKIARVAKEYCRSMGNTTTPSYEDLEESRQLPPTDLDCRLLIVPKERGEHQEENEFFSERIVRYLALQNASDTLMSAINPRDKDIRLAKQYKERIHGDVGGSWVIRAQMESVTDELEAAMTTGDPHMSLKTQTKQEIFSPRAEHLQAGSSKVCIGGEIPLDAALLLMNLTLTETPEAFNENNQLEGPGWNARGLVNSPNTTGPGIPFSSRYSDPGNMA
ncbi:hypothetical protein GYMLUDRAFT_251832 [Collybiopsis luxurians FD-317 M1]|uniref:Uncharacterized protein n=1 Tax=Collybiopsis luxurians FD-317 M1 TaxID=944289 RepID=A0A0D0AN82_9AGAR|nr:hypothetical protein GYMLUDRAFT_251832 [Collybiopsis luxurians FD-317 M1]